MRGHEDVCWVKGCCKLNGAMPSENALKLQRIAAMLGQYRNGNLTVDARATVRLQMPPWPQ
eukprot:1897795-Amphidinium_carterae.1